METEAQRGQWLISAHRSTGTRPHDSGAGPWRPEQHSYTGGGVSGLVNKGLVCSESTSRVGLWQADGWGGWCQRPGHRGASGAQKEGGENGMAPFPLFFPTLAFGLRLADNIQSTWLNLNFRQATNHF